jgi:hypothetical protein
MSATAVFVLIGMLGLSTDVGRMFIYKSELQMFADASAMAAITYMDGTQAGVQGANAVATAGPLGTTKPNGYNFDTQGITNVTTGYATTYTGTYDSYSTASGSATNSYRFLKVTASADLSLSFLPVLPGVPTSMTLSATAVAGQKASTTVTNGGLVPFAPDAHDQSDTKNFGFVPGQEYTLKWGTNGSQDVTTCAGDAGFTPPGQPPSGHGFVNIGEGTGSSGIRQSIEYGGFPNSLSTPSSLYIDEDIYEDPGDRGREIFDALQARVNQDTDTSSTTYADYVSRATGNGRRIVTAPIAGTWTGNGSNANTPILGFGNFLLDTTYSGNSGSICAVYIGPGNTSGRSTGASDGTKIYSTTLYQ